MRQNLLYIELDAPEFILEWASPRQNQGMQSGNFTQTDNLSDKGWASYPHDHPLADNKSRSICKQ